MIEQIEQQILKLENGDKRSKSLPLSFRCPLPIYKMIYYYMRDNNVDDKTEAIRDLLSYGFSYYAELGDKDE